jgi:hypothetical protein
LSVYGFGVAPKYQIHVASFTKSSVGSILHPP